MIETRPFQPLDLPLVMSGLSDQHLAELYKSGHNPVDVFHSLMTFIDAGEAVTIFIDGRAQAILAVAGKHTWFVASKAYFAAGPRAIRASRRIMRDMVAKHGPLFSTTASPHKDTHRWMRVLGAALQEKRGETSRYIFR